MTKSIPIMLGTAIGLLLLEVAQRVSAFTIPHRSSPPPLSCSSIKRTRQSRSTPPSPLRSSSIENPEEEDAEGMLAPEIETIVGENWMKRSSSIDFQPALMNSNLDSAEEESIYMDVGINGNIFGTGELSKRMYEALMKVAAAKFDGKIPNELGIVYLLYSMDASAKETVKVAMDSNGYALNLGDEEAMQDEGSWGTVDSVVLVDPATNEPTKGEDGSDSYDSFMDAINLGGWEPGDEFSFVVREVPARKKAMDLAALLKAMDPDGTLWEEAKEKGIVMPGDEVYSLKALSEDCEQRVKTAPMEVLDDFKVFRGGDSKGYNVISRSALLRDGRNADGTERKKTLLHVMDAFANHGCLIVDLTDGDSALDNASKMSKMWETTSTFFDKVNDDVSAIPPMQQAEGVGSSHAMVGFAAFKDGENEFCETRIRRSDGTLLPEEISSVVGVDGSESMVDAFNLISEVGKDVVRIVTAASSVEADAFVTAGSVVTQEEGSPSIAGLSFEEAFPDEEDAAGDRAPSEEDYKRAEILASDAAILLTDEIMDDGKPLTTGDIEHSEGPVSMSPHRMCRYSNNNNVKQKKASEIFGAHTDTSFVTIVPAAKVSGLEVFDEDSLQWYRPELNARKHAKGLDPSGSKDEQFPWHSRYLIVMPGELLQLTSRNNIPAAVHRVVAATDVPRMSAPVLLRARPGTKMDVERYMGGLETADGLLTESNGMKMEAIHDALQPAPKQ